MKTDKEDCFAYPPRAFKHECGCLTELVCESGKCSFYKSKKQFRDDLMRIHGTTNTSDIGAAYAAGKVREDE